MSYNGTVRCRHCYKTGHNVKSCETLTKEVKNDVGGYYHRRYSKYFNHDGTRKQASAVNLCSYCDTAGHTKRTCDTKLIDTIANIKTNSEYRNDMHSWLKKRGMGIGSLITINEKLFLVTGYNWKYITCGVSSYDKPHINVDSVEGHAYYKSISVDDYMVKHGQHLIQVESPVHELSPPEEWFDGKTEYYDFNTSHRVTNPFRS